MKNYGIPKGAQNTLVTSNGQRYPFYCRYNCIRLCSSRTKVFKNWLPKITCLALRNRLKGMLSIFHMKLDKIYKWRYQTVTALKKQKTNPSQFRFLATEKVREKTVQYGSLYEKKYLLMRRTDKNIKNIL